jgi:formiminotetrahydrofolate cyclodeaminase
MQETKIAHKKDITTWHAADSFLDSSKVGEALLQCLIDNDTETYIEILESYLRITTQG